MDTPSSRTQYLLQLLNANRIEMTTPNKPRSSKQKYRLTPLGHNVIGRQAAKS